MASRVQTPPVNLKERIAALQQRNVSPNQHSSTIASKGIPTTGTGTLRDKIAKFEEKGGIPVPRGSFAMGVPPPSTDGVAAKKRGELYGNRIQGLGRPNGPPVSRSGSPMPLDGDTPNPRKRCISTGGALSSPLTTFNSGDSVPPVPNSATLHTPRRNSLAINFGLGRRAVSTGCAGSPSDGLDWPSPSPLPNLSSAEEPDDVAAAITTPLASPSYPLETSEVLFSAGSPSDALDSPSPPSLPSPSPAEEPDGVVTAATTTPLASPSLPLETSEVLFSASSLSDALDSPSPSSLPRPSPAEDDVITTAIATQLTSLSLSPETAKVLVSAKPPTSHHQEEDAEDSVVEEEFVSFTTEPEQSTVPDGSTPTPDVDATLLDDESTSDAVSPDTKSTSDVLPLDCELSSSPAMDETVGKSDPLLDRGVVTQPIHVVSQPFPSSEPPTAPPVLPADSISCSLPSTAEEKPDTVSSPAALCTIAAVATTNVFEEQPISTTSVTAMGSNEQDKARLPSPLLKPKVTPSEKRTTFKAVVHRKVTETPAATAPASSLAASPTPQVPKVRRSVVANVNNSLSNQAPGELTILLEEAALLELKLTGGDASENLDLSSLKTPTSATFQSDPRSESATTLTEQKPVSPSPDADCFSRLSISIPAIREPVLDPEIPEIPEEDEASDGKSLASTTFSQRSPSHRKYLSSFRRLTNRRSSANMPGAYPRDSISLSSEDSASVATPPDTGSGRNGSFGIAWPSVSPKRGAGRASSFTEKLFNRSRTRSNVSNLSAAETDRSSLYETPQRSLNIPSPEVSPPGRRSGQDAGPRSATWASRDSCSELSPTSPSSFFDKDIFDAFPSVPQTLPSAPHPLFEVGDVEVGRASTLPVKSRKH